MERLGFDCSTQSLILYYLECQLFNTNNCEITEIKECDILFQIKYKRKCDECDYTENSEHQFMSVLKNGYTMDIDNWHCPHCGKLCETKINYNNSSQEVLSIP